MNKPVLFLIGVTHRTAPFGFREKVSMVPEAESELSRELALITGLYEFVVLSTCNRVEIYGMAADTSIPQRIVSAICACQKVDREDFDRWGLTVRGQEAVAHLLAVVSGLDSQLLGETEIFGQVKRAYATAQSRGSVGPILNRLFQKAFQSAKIVRTKTAVASGQVSVANVAVDLALDIFGGIESATVLLIGAGEMAEKSGRAFASRGARNFLVASRRPERAARLAGELGARILDFDERETHLENSDIVVCSTAAPGLMISGQAVNVAMKQRLARPLLLIDLAMPRDVDPSVVSATNVFLYNLDDLAVRAEKNRQLRLVAAAHGHQMLVPRTASLWQQIQSQTTGRNGNAILASSELTLEGSVPFAGFA